MFTAGTQLQESKLDMFMYPIVFRRARSCFLTGIYLLTDTLCMRQTPGYCVAYVGNIAFEATEDDLRAVFDGLAVTRVRMHTDAGTGRFKGYAHVHFGDEACLDACALPVPHASFWLCV